MLDRFARLLLCSLFFATHAVSASERAPFSFAGKSIPAGETRSWHVAPGDGLPAIPVSVFHGALDGPVVTLSAGIHGDEFPAITALQRLRLALGPSNVAGTVVLIHGANIASLHQRGLSPLTPADGLNLNRAFPGSSDGEPTERLARFLTDVVVAKSDYLADLHSGSADQWLWPHIYSPFVGDSELDARTLAWAKASGMRHVVLYGDRPLDPENSISYPNTAMTRGKPGLTLEIGDRGRNDAESIGAYEDALWRLLDHLGVVDHPMPAADGHVIYERLVDVETPETGLFEAHCAIGETVGAGALLGTVRDYFGAPIAELRAPAAGVVLMLRHKPPVEAGSGLVTLGIARAKT